MKPLHSIKFTSGAQRLFWQLCPKNRMPAAPHTQHRALMSMLIKRQQAEELRCRSMASSNQGETSLFQPLPPKTRACMLTSSEFKYILTNHDFTNIKTR